MKDGQSGSFDGSYSPTELIRLGTNGKRMEDWMEAWTKVHHHHYTVVAVLGLLATVALASPGESVFALGPLRFDAYYATLAAFGLLLLVSLTDRYDREDYTLDRGDSDNQNEFES